MAGAIINFGIMLLFILIGVTFSQGKGAAFIAGYNTMSDGEQAKIDEVAMCKFMGKVMYGAAFGLLLIGLSELFNLQILMFVGIASCVICPIFAVVYMNAGDRFKRQDVEERTE